jgi:cytochrome o ubiquinol oxidase subunit 2
MSAADFDRWVQATSGAGAELNRDAYLALAHPSENEPVRHYGAVAPDLYDAILNRCVQPGRPCIRDMRATDAQAARN